MDDFSPEMLKKSVLNRLMKKGERSARELHKMIEKQRVLCGGDADLVLRRGSHSPDGG